MSIKDRWLDVIVIPVAILDCFTAHSCFVNGDFLAMTEIFIILACMFFAYGMAKKEKKDAEKLKRIRELKWA